MDRWNGVDGMDLRGTGGRRETPGLFPLSQLCNLTTLHRRIVCSLVHDMRAITAVTHPVYHFPRVLRYKLIRTACYSPDYQVCPVVGTFGGDRSTLDRTGSFRDVGRHTRSLDFNI